jgi:hypothetical protein
MASTVTAKIETVLFWTVANALDHGTASFPARLEITNDLTNGTNAADKANQLWSDTRTLSGLASENIDLYDFAGATDGVGNALAIAKVKSIIIYNQSSTVGNNLKVGGLGTGAAFNSLFDGSDDAKIIVGPGGFFGATNPSAAGLAVADSTNHILKIENAGATSTTYDIVIIGTTT